MPLGNATKATQYNWCYLIFLKLSPLSLYIWSVLCASISKGKNKLCEL